MKKIAVSVSILIASLVTVVDANAADATLGYQIVQQGTLLEQYSTQASQLQQQISMLQDAYRNSTGLPIQAWSSAQSYINQLTGLIGNASGLSYSSSNVLDQVNTTYGNGETILPDYKNRVGDWNKNILSQVGSVLRAYNQQTNTALDVQRNMETIMNASQTAQGRMQVLQAGNQIASIAVNELQNLQQVVMAGNQAQLNYIASQTEKQNQREKPLKNFLKPTNGNW